MSIHALPALPAAHVDDATRPAERAGLRDARPPRRVGIRYPWVQSRDRRAA
jgi:hypothetical protein